MRKSTLAIAIAAAIAVPMTAQADTTLYGQAHLSLDYQDGDNGDGIDLLSNSSRVGVKGSHKLSDALSAVYQMEWGVTMDGEGSSMGERNRVAGLKGGFGTVLFGKHDTPFKTLGNAVAEDWGSTQIGGARQIRSATGAPGTLAPANSWDVRADNVIAYISPSFGPVSIFAAYSPDILGGNSGADNNEFTDADDGAEATSIVLNIGDKKKYYLGVGYEQHDTDALGDQSAIRVGGIANFGPIRLHGLYQQASDGGFVEGADRDVYGVGASFKSGPNKFKAQYYVADDVDGTDETGGDLAMIGWDHSLAKSTTVYLQYATLSNDDNSSFTLSGNGHGGGFDQATGGDIDGFSAGLQVKF